MTMDLIFTLPELQVSFASKLQEFREVWLQNALLNTIGGLQVSTIDQELKSFVSEDDLQTLAAKGLRGELVFAVPAVLRANPRLLAYYRLLLGYSQKEFYGKDFGISSFKSMEIDGKISSKIRFTLDELCQALCNAASHLVAGLNNLDLNIGLLDDLTLLTVGPQMRGGVNNKLGQEGIVEVFSIIQDILKHAIVTSTPVAIEIKNAGGRDVWVEFAADPDIVIREIRDDKTSRKILAIEVKSGKDFSNIHNRIGEAEKSHQKAKNAGYTECWTVVNVPNLDIAKAKTESPTTNTFFALNDLKSKKGPAYEKFKHNIIAMVGIASA
nr:XcyI family restriction endonuclease [uncultured bacterium]